MIARLDGILLQKSVAQCVVDIHGIGYRIVVPLSTFYELPDAGCRVVLQIHTHVREDAVSLYGFHTDEEREVFKLMISVGGIGPKLAVNILSGISAAEIKDIEPFALVHDTGGGVYDICAAIDIDWSERFSSSFIEASSDGYSEVVTVRESELKNIIKRKSYEIAPTSLAIARILASAQ